MTFDDAVTFALTLPGAEKGTSYRQPAVKVNGKAFLNVGHEPDTSFVVRCPEHEKMVLIETDPDTFWQTAHYEGWPAVLIRYTSPERERIEIVITRAWWDYADKAQREAFGDRP
ncbi:MmcQ/YjbR family DNA-binding protein [Stakelama sediminis]|uniref:MmcQ/YjbR family DNA-binding protein n=1 Tax=Stakelama sediminis TaxID=463200 RepID=A0A840YWJ3_9SPHN|nr:MmcQ/YjbR family DNA-binding protein [Stakelama sediminis]MBB5717922.1 hypothetical protein [Stakelama sediminis]